MKHKFLCILFVLGIAYSSVGQITIHFLGKDSLNLQNIVAYPTYASAGYYFAIDYGQAQAQTQLQSLSRRLNNGDSSLLLKSDNNVSIAFSGLAHFLNYMYANNWELLSVQCPTTFNEVSERGAIKTTGTLSSDQNFSFLIFRKRK